MCYNNISINSTWVVEGGINLSGTDIFVAVICAVMLFGGLYLNFVSRKLSNQYFESHKPEINQPKAPISKPVKR